MLDDDELWRKLSYIQLSKNRKLALQYLYELKKPLTPTELSKKMGISFNSASRAVRQLAKNDLAVCINPEVPRYRRYRITEQGRLIWKTLEEIEN